MRLEKQNVPTALRPRINIRLRNYEQNMQNSRSRLATLADSRADLFGRRYTDDPEAGGAADAHYEQRQQLLSGTERLDRSTQRLRASQQLASETEAIGASTLADLHGQRETIRHAHDRLLESEGYVDRSIKTLRSMARR